MDWTQLIRLEMEGVYKNADHLMSMCDDGRLGWKPSPENNWMTLGQLLNHVSEACGMAIKGFVTGDWGLPPGTSLSDLKPEDMLPPAEKMPAIASVAEARRKLAEDRKTGFECLAQAGEEALATRVMAAPWDPTEKLLGQHLLAMVDHLKIHRAQLFYYLKLLGKPVNTMDLWM